MFCNSNLPETRDGRLIQANPWGPWAPVATLPMPNAPMGASYTTWRDTSGGSLYMFVPPDGWEPVYYKLEYGEENHGISNYPEEFMSFRPSDKLHMERGPENHDGRPMLNQGCRPLGVRG